MKKNELIAHRVKLNKQSSLTAIATNLTTLRHTALVDPLMHSASFMTLRKTQLTASVPNLTSERKHRIEKE